MKKMSDTRGGEIQNISYEIRSSENKNERAHQENKNIALAIKGLKEERKILEEECDKMDNSLDDNTLRLKNL